MTKQERLIVSAYTGVLMCDFSEFQIYVEQLLQRPVFTHELAMADVWSERFFVPLHIWRIVRLRAATHFSICL